MVMVQSLPVIRWLAAKQAAATMGTTVIRMGNRDLKIYQAASRDNAINSSPSRASDPFRR